MGTASAAEILVGPDLGNATIGAALINATDGDTIIVGDGTYTENLLVYKEVTLRSENGSASTIIQAASPGMHVFNITADNVAIQGFNVIGPTNYSSIYMLSVSNCNISDNVISESYAGIFCSNVSNSDLINNTITSSVQGIYLYDSPNNTLINNIMASNDYNFGGYGTSPEHFFQNIDTSNQVDGKPIYYIIDQADMQVPSDAGQVYVVNSTNITVKDIAIANGYEGIVFAYTDNSKIENVTVSENEYGIVLFKSNSNILDNINVNNNYYGIFLSNSTNNDLVNNIISSNGWDGISIYSSSEMNTIDNNTISSNGCDGIYLDNSRNNTLSNNTVTDNPEIGINLLASADNHIIGNAVNNNSYGGIYLDRSINNTLMDNTMVSNRYNFGIAGTSPGDYFQNIDTSNRVDGKALYYLVNQADVLIPPDAGQVYALNSTNITFRDAEISKAYDGVFFVGTNNSTIENVTVSYSQRGICLSGSSSNVIGDIRLSNNLMGMMVESSEDITLSQSNINSNHFGIMARDINDSILTNINANGNAFVNMAFFLSNGNYLNQNTASSSTYGLHLFDSNNNQLVENSVCSNSNVGIYFTGSANNTLISNNASHNHIAGIRISSSDNNTLISNTFSNNIISPGDLTSVSLSTELSDNEQLFEQAFINDLSDVISLNSQDMLSSVSLDSARSGSYGIYVSDSMNNVLSNNRAYDNDYALCVRDCDYITVNEIIVNGDHAGISFTGNIYELLLSETFSVPASPSGKTNVNGYVKLSYSGYESLGISGYSGPGSMDITLSYDDSGMSSAEESSIALFSLDSSTWVRVPNATLSTSNNTVSANVRGEDIDVQSIMISYPTAEITLALFKDSERTGSSGSSVVARERREGTITGLSLGNNGELAKDTVVKSSDSTTTLTLFTGTKALDPLGNPVNSIIVTTPSSLPSDTPREVIESGLYFRFGPSGTTFSQEVMITMDFDPELFEGRAPVIYTYTSKEGWIALETTVDWENGRATAMISHFSLYALFGTDSEETQDLVVETQGTDIVLPATPEEEAPAGSEGGFGYLYWMVGVVIVLGLGIVVVTKQKDKEGEL
jgi:parallel beta-helix repeat protein